jgi:hypothetical protein
MTQTFTSYVKSHDLLKQICKFEGYRIIINLILISYNTYLNTVNIGEINELWMCCPGVGQDDLTASDHIQYQYSN